MPTHTKAEKAKILAANKLKEQQGAAARAAKAPLVPHNAAGLQARFDELNSASNAGTRNILRNSNQDFAKQSHRPGLIQREPLTGNVLTDGIRFKQGFGMQFGESNQGRPRAADPTPTANELAREQANAPATSTNVAPTTEKSYKYGPFSDSVLRASRFGLYDPQKKSEDTFTPTPISDQAETPNTEPSLGGFISEKARQFSGHIKDNYVDNITKPLNLIAQANSDLTSLPAQLGENLYNSGAPDGLRGAGKVVSRGAGAVRDFLGPEGPLQTHNKEQAAIQDAKNTNFVNSGLDGNTPVPAAAGLTPEQIAAGVTPGQAAEGPPDENAELRQRAAEASGQKIVGTKEVNGKAYGVTEDGAIVIDQNTINTGPGSVTSQSGIGIYDEQGNAIINQRSRLGGNDARPEGAPYNAVGQVPEALRQTQFSGGRNSDGRTLRAPEGSRILSQSAPRPSGNFTMQHASPLAKYADAQGNFTQAGVDRAVAGERGRISSLREKRFGGGAAPGRQSFGGVNTRMNEITARNAANGGDVRDINRQFDKAIRNVRGTGVHSERTRAFLEGDRANALSQYRRTQQDAANASAGSGLDAGDILRASGDAERNNIARDRLDFDRNKAILDSQNITTMAQFDRRTKDRRLLIENAASVLDSDGKKITDPAFLNRFVSVIGQGNAYTMSDNDFSSLTPAMQQQAQLAYNYEQVTGELFTGSNLIGKGRTFDDIDWKDIHDSGRLGVVDKLAEFFDFIPGMGDVQFVNLPGVGNVRLDELMENVTEAAGQKKSRRVRRKN